MKKSLATILCSISFLNVFCQKAPFKFGEVPPEEVKMTHYARDSSASAVILGDFGISKVEYDQTENWFILKFERTTRVKILTKDGYEQADFEVALYHSGSDKEKLSGLKVITYNLDGDKIVESKMKSDAVFEEKYDQNTDVMKFTAPNVKEGSVIEVTYKITSDFLSYFRDWEFQSTVPVVWSEYRAYIPEYFNYDKYTQGYVVLSVNESRESPKSIIITSKERSEGQVTKTTFYNDKIDYMEKAYRWAASDVPAFKEEPYMTTYLDYISKINFELANYKMPNQPIKIIMGTWEGLNKSMLESDYFGGAVKGSGFLKKAVEEITVGLNTPEEKTSAIYSYVKSNIEWDGAYRKFLGDESLKDALEKKKGSSAYINLTLVSMLQKADLDANPVILSTRNHGFVRESMALSSQFNYVIASVNLNGKTILLDATDRMLPIGTLPERCLNGQGYLISQTNPGWVKLTSPGSRVVAEATLTINDEGKFNGQLKIKSDGYAARKVRNIYLSKGEAEYVNEFQGTKTFQIAKSEFTNMQTLGEAVEEKYDFTWEETSSVPGTIFFGPILHLGEVENPFKAEKREYPVDFGSTFEKVFMLKLTIPENYLVDEIPPGKVYLLPGKAGRYLYNAQVNGSTINITSMLTISKGLFAQTEYPSLREFYNLVVAKQSEQIVLKKKEN